MFAILRSATNKQIQVITQEWRLRELPLDVLERGRLEHHQLPRRRASLALTYDLPPPISGILIDVFFLGVVDAHQRLDRFDRSLSVAHEVLVGILSP